MERIYTGWAEITKIDAEQHIVEGYATTELPDSQGGLFQGERYVGDLVEADAVKAALPDYMEWANIREMHDNKAVGTVLKAEMQPDGRLLIVAKIVDGDAWEKVKEGVYKGFSIAGDLVRAVLDKIDGKVIRRIKELILKEISLVDRPANPGARILLWKMDGGNPASETIEIDGGEPVDKSTIQKAADPQKALAMLQTLRDEAELAGDLNGAGLFSQAIALLLQANGDAESETEEAETETETEAESASEETAYDDAVDGVDAEATESEEEESVTMSAKPTGLRKAGRVLSKANAGAMHSVIQSLAKMLADTGDEVAANVVKCYGERMEGKADQAADLQKIADANLEKLEATISTLAERLEKLEAQPAPGGPVLRSVEKHLATEVPQVQPEPEAKPVESVAELRRQAAIEPNPILKAELNRRVWIIEHNLSK